MTDHHFLNIIDRVGAKLPEAPRQLAALVRLLEIVSGIEPYTLFTTKTFETVSAQITEDKDLLSMVMQMNMYLEAIYSADEEYQKRSFKLIRGMVESISPQRLNGMLTGIRKDLKDAVADSEYDTVQPIRQFFTQLVDVPEFAIFRTMGTWYKIIVFLNYHYTDVIDLLRPTSESS